MKFQKIWIKIDPAIIMQHLDGDVSTEEDDEREEDNEHDPQDVGQLTALEVVVMFMEDTGFHIFMIRLFWLFTRISSHPEKDLQHGVPVQ